MTPWTVAGQAPPSMGFPRQEYWSGWPPPSAGGLPDPGVEPVSPALAGRFLTTELPGKPPGLYSLKINKISLKIVVRRPEGGALTHKSLILFTQHPNRKRHTLYLWQEATLAYHHQQERFLLAWQQVCQRETGTTQPIKSHYDSNSPFPSKDFCL